MKMDLEKASEALKTIYQEQTMRPIKYKKIYCFTSEEIKYLTKKIRKEIRKQYPDVEWICRGWELRLESYDNKPKKWYLRITYQLGGIMYWFPMEV